MNARNKGKRGEREFFNLQNELLGSKVFERNLDQTRAGGADSISDTDFAVEVKRQENLPYPAAIRQAKEQAASVGKLPVLAHRRSKEDWNVMVILTPKQFAAMIQQQSIYGKVDLDFIRRVTDVPPDQSDQPR